MSEAWQQDPGKAATEWTEQFVERMQTMIEERPASAVLLAFGAGFAIGAAVGGAASEMVRRPPQRGSVAEQLGRQVLEAVGRILPESLVGRFQS